jgi:hypothetical protein
MGLLNLFLGGNFSFTPNHFSNNAIVKTTIFKKAGFSFGVKTLEFGVFKITNSYKSLAQTHPFLRFWFKTLFCSMPRGGQTDPMYAKHNSVLLK